MVLKIKATIIDEENEYIVDALDSVPIPKKGFVRIKLIWTQHVDHLTVMVVDRYIEPNKTFVMPDGWPGDGSLAPERFITS